MSGLFGAISNIQVDVQHNQAWFSYEDIKLHLHDAIIEVDQAVLSFEQFNAAMDQLDATMVSIESMNGMVDEQVMSIVNHDNQLGKLFGIYIPESLRFEMADEAPAGQTGNQTGTATDAKPAATNAEKQQTGESVTDKAKEVAKKMWEMLKAFFEKIARGLKSFWQWLMNGFMTNKASNEKLLEAIKVDQQNGYPKLNKALQEAQGFIDASQEKSNETRVSEITSKISKAQILIAMDDSDCGKVMTKLNDLGIWNKPINELLNGVDEAALKDVFMKVTPAGEGGLLPTIGVDKEAIAALKKNKAALSTKGWTPNTVLDCIVVCNSWYENAKQISTPKFIEASGKYDWENSTYVKDGKVEPKLAKRQCQAVCKFYTQFCKLCLALVDVLQAHINAIKKPFNVAVGQPQAAPEVNTSDVKGAPGPATGQQPANQPAAQAQPAAQTTAPAGHMVVQVTSGKCRIASLVRLYPYLIPRMGKYDRSLIGNKWIPL